jgi:enamine deaminase RidA (YjgF/YER057c/UK114 family)
MLVLSEATHAQSPEQKLKDSNIELPSVSSSLGNYIDVVQVGNLLFLSGKGPLTSEGKYIEGKLGDDLTIEQGYTAARVAAVNQLAVLKSYVGDLRRIKRIVKVNGFVNCVNSFEDQPKVINGFSDLMVEIFGESGKHARTAVGTNSLPRNMAVEVEMVVEIR